MKLSFSSFCLLAMISLAVVKAAPLPPVNFLEEAEKAAAAVGGHSQGASSSSIDDLSSEFAKLKPIKTRPGVAPSNIYPGTPRPMSFVLLLHATTQNTWKSRSTLIPGYLRRRESALTAPASFPGPEIDLH